MERKIDDKPEKTTEGFPPLTGQPRYEIIPKKDNSQKIDPNFGKYDPETGEPYAVCVRKEDLSKEDWEALTNRTMSGTRIQFGPPDMEFFGGSIAWLDPEYDEVPENERLLFEVTTYDVQFPWNVVIGERMGLYIECDDGTYPLRSIRRWASID